MTRVAVDLYPTTGLPVPAGTYVCDLPDGRTEPVDARMQLYADGALQDAFAFHAVLDPFGEVSVWNGAMHAYLGEVRTNITVASRAKPVTHFDIMLYDGCGYVARDGNGMPMDSYVTALLEGATSHSLDGVMDATMSLFPNAPSDNPKTHSSGSARMASHYAGALRGAALRGGKITHGLAQLNVNLLRPVHYHYDGDDGALAWFTGAAFPNSGTHKGYGNNGGLGTKLYNASEHFGRPPGESASPWNPDDSQHFAAHQWAGYAALTHSFAACVHLSGMIESLWREIVHGKWASARCYGPLFGAIGEGLLVFRRVPGWNWYADHLVEVVLPAVLDKLDGESARVHDVAKQLGVEPLWTPNVMNRGDRDDHIEHGQTSWMTGMLVIGLVKLLHWLRNDGTNGLPLYKRARQHLLLAIDVLSKHTFNDPNGRGWTEDSSPFGEHGGSSTHAVFGKYREYILPALETAALFMRAEAAHVDKPASRIEYAERLEWQANLLADWLVGGGWGESSTQSWERALADEFWLTASRLNAVTRDDWATALAS